jgi:PAS domain S-box-containing protein
LGSLPQKVFLKDLHSVYVLCNAIYAQDLRIGVAEIAGKTDFDFYPAALAEKYRADDARVMATRKPERLEEEYVRDGRTVAVETIKSPVIDADGNVTGVLGVFWDVTEQRRSRRELARAQSLLLAAIEQSPAGVLIADAPDAQIRVANSAALGIRGGDAAHLTNIPVELHPQRWQTYRPDGTPFPPEELPLSRAVLEGRTSTNVEVVIRRADGEARHVLANAAPVRDAGGRIVAGIVVFPDVTELKRAEAALRHREARFREIAHGMGDWIWEIDAEGRYTYVSPSVHDILGYEPEEMLGKTPFDLMPEGEAERVRKSFEDIARERKAIVDLENWNLRKSGGCVCFLTNGVPVKSPGGEFAGYRGVGKDITERKAAEEELQKHRAKLEELVRLRTADLRDALSASEAITAASPVGITAYDATGQCVMANETVARIIGATREQVLAQNFRQIESWRQSGLLAAAERVLAGGPDERLEIEQRTSFGRDVWMQCSLTRFASGDGRRLLFVCDDITARKRAEQELQQSERRLFQFLDNVPAGIYILDAKTRRPYYANDRAKRILGRGVVPDASPEELPEAYDAYLAGTDQLYPPERQPVFRALAGESVTVEDMEIRRPDRRILLRVTAAPIVDTNGAVTYSIAAFYEIPR